MNLIPFDTVMCNVGYKNMKCENMFNTRKILEIPSLWIYANKTHNAFIFALRKMLKIV